LSTKPQERCQRVRLILHDVLKGQCGLRISSYLERGHIFSLSQSWRVLALLLKPTVNTAGWEQVIRPFLEQHGNPTKLFKIMRDGKQNSVEGAYQAGKVEAYNNILKFVNLLMEALTLAERDQ
jgi:hypothetical protein